MKKIITLMLAIGFAGASFSQKETAIKKIYLQLSAGPGTYNGIVQGVDVQAVLKHNWTTTFSYTYLEMNPKNLPSDYDGSFLWIFNYTPDVQMNLYSLTAGKCFQAGRKIWFTTEAGLSLVNGEKMTFTRQGSASGDYSDVTEKENTIGGMFKADFTWATQFVGLGVGVFANVNSIQSPVGAEFKLSLGWMNIKRKH
jgi:hypothetical protein